MKTLLTWFHFVSSFMMLRLYKDIYGFGNFTKVDLFVSLIAFFLNYKIMRTNF